MNPTEEKSSSAGRAAEQHAFTPTIAYETAERTWHMQREGDFLAGAKWQSAQVAEAVGILEKLVHGSATVKFEGGFRQRQWAASEMDAMARNALALLKKEGTR